MCWIQLINVFRTKPKRIYQEDPKVRSNLNFDLFLNRYFISLLKIISVENQPEFSMHIQPNLNLFLGKN